MNQKEQTLRAALTGESGCGSFGANWMVEAGAGAGKTYIIAWRIVRQLLAGHCRPEELVAITFTNKATNELRERVTQYLRRMWNDCRDPAERERRKDLYRNAGTMHISTIHGFCQSLLQEMPLQAGLGLEPTLLDQEETDAYYRKCFDRALREHEDWFEPMERLGISASQLEKPFRTAVRSQEQSMPYDRTDSAEYGDRARQLVKAAEELRQKLHTEFDGCDPSLYGDWIAEALELPAIDTVEGAMAFSHGLDRLLTMMQQKDNPYKVKSGRRKADGKTDTTQYALNGLVCEDSGLYTAWDAYLVQVKQHREKEAELAKERAKKRQTQAVQDSIRELEQELTDLHNQLMSVQATPEWKIMDAAVTVSQTVGRDNCLAQLAAPLYYTAMMEPLERCVAWVREQQQRENLLTYDDLLLRTRDLLRDSPQAWQRLRRRYRVLYVDEFQDTDPIQAQILFYLTTSEDAFSTDWTRCRPEPGSLFLVGDPKQSIYRFRGADLSVYQTVRAIFQREQAQDPNAFAIAELQTNFRSTEPVCTRVTGLFAHRLDGQNGQADFLAMEATADKDCVGGMYAWRAPDEETCAAQVAAMIEQAVRDHQASFEDFLVLTPTRAPAGLYYQALRSRNIPAELSGETKYSDVEPVRRLGLWCDLLLRPGDDIARMQVLQWCFGVSPVELYALQQRTGRSLRELFSIHPVTAEEMAAADARQRQVMTAMETVRRAVGLISVLPPMALVEELVRDRYGIWPGGTPQEADYGWLCQYLETLRGYGGQTLHALLRQAVRLARTGRVERQLTLRETERCVRVMNVHKAKGLEGRIVILAQGKWINRAVKEVRWRNCLWFSVQDKIYDSRGNAWKLLAQPRQWEEAAAEEERQTQRERERLYYVAATRAGQTLLVCQQPLTKNGLPPQTDYWGPLDLPILAADTVLTGCSAKALLQPDSVGCQLPDDPLTLPDARWDRRQKTAAAQVPQSRRRSITPSGLNHPAPPVRQADDGAALPVPVQKADTQASDDAAVFTPHGPDWGTMVHRTMELAVERRAWDGAARQRCARQAVEETLPPTVPLTAQQRKMLLDGQTPDGYEAMAETLCAAVTAATGFLEDPDSGLRRCLDQGSAWTELPFFLQVADEGDPLHGHIAAYAKDGGGAVLEVQGIIDLAVQTPTGWLVVDYKTDRLRPGETEEAYCRRLCAEYTPQIQSYVLVLRRLGLGTVRGAWLCSIPLGGRLLELPLPEEPAK